MTLQGVRILLLLFALAAFAGGGAALAMARFRGRADGQRDFGLAGIAGMFLLFGTLCTLAASGIFGVLAFGGVVTWGSYLLTAQRVGLFTIEVHSDAPPEPAATQDRRHA